MSNQSNGRPEKDMQLLYLSSFLKVFIAPPTSRAIQGWPHWGLIYRTMCVKSTMTEQSLASGAEGGHSEGGEG
jgi:hypothetical protein